MRTKKEPGPTPAPPVDVWTLLNRPATALVALVLDRRIRAIEAELLVLEQLEDQLLVGDH